MLETFFGYLESINILFLEILLGLILTDFISLFFMHVNVCVFFQRVYLVLELKERWEKARIFVKLFTKEKHMLFSYLSLVPMETMK